MPHITAVAPAMSTFGSASVSPSRAQPWEHTATGTAEAFFGHPKTVDDWQKNRSPSFGQSATAASIGGGVAALVALVAPRQSDGASAGSRASTSLSTAQPWGHATRRFHSHGHPAQLARPVLISIEPSTQRASPVGQSCFTANADASEPGSDSFPRAQPRSHAAVARQNAAVDNAARRRHKWGRGIMANERIQSFEEFWPYYVREHSKKATRTFHFVGTTAAMALVGYAAIRRKAWPLLLAPIAGYGPAWISHFFIEGNKPATFKYPRWSLQADFVMWSKMVRGTMDDEVARVLRDEPEKSRPTERTAAAPS